MSEGIVRVKRNADALNEVADAIEEGRNDWGFEMDRWITIPDVEESPQISESEFYHGKRPKHNCGTSFCIAGWAVALFPRRATSNAFRFDANPKEEFSIERRGKHILGLSEEDADRLFYADIETPLRAARTLRILALGEPDVRTAIESANNKRSFERRVAKLAG